MVNYGDFKVIKTWTKEDAESIRSLFNVTTEDFWKAVDDILPSAPETAWGYFFVCDCIREGKKLREEAGTYEEYTESDPYGADTPELDDKIYEAAESTIPYQTFVIWMVWLDCGGWQGDVPDGYQFSEAVGSTYELPQLQLFQWAEQIVYRFARDD